MWPGVMLPSISSKRECKRSTCAEEIFFKEATEDVSISVNPRILRAESAEGSGQNKQPGGEISGSAMAHISMQIPPSESWDLHVNPYGVIRLEMTERLPIEQAG